MLFQNSLSLEKLKKCYEQMVLIRRFEERAGQLYGQGLIGGFCHLYIGQEAVVVGIQSSQKQQDTVITSYRDHGHMLACDMDPNGVMAELTGRSGGYSKGKGGSMHMFSKEKNFFGGHGIVGAQVSIGTGMAFAHKYKKDNGVCVSYMGDGAINQGQTSESFNMAALWKLPIVFVVEDNQYAMGTSVHRGSANSDFSKRGIPYDIPSLVVDGMNLLDVIEKATIALNHAREKGPYLLHVKTYRYRGHSMSDPAKYRSKEEVEEIKEHHDAIDLLKNHLIKEYSMTENEFEEIDEKIKAIMLDVIEFSKTSPEPDEKELYTNVLLGE